MAMISFSLFVLLISSVTADPLRSLRQKRQSTLFEADSTCCDGSYRLGTLLGCQTIGSTCYCNNGNKEALRACWYDSLSTFEADPACCYSSSSEYFQARDHCSYNNNGQCQCKDVDDVSSCKKEFFTARPACCSSTENYSLYRNVRAYCYTNSAGNCRCSNRTETQTCRDTTTGTSTGTNTVTSSGTGTTNTGTNTGTSTNTGTNTGTDTGTVTTNTGTTNTGTDTTGNTGTTNTGTSSSPFLALAGCCDATVINLMNFNFGNNCYTNSDGNCECVQTTTFSTEVCRPDSTVGGGAIPGK